VREQESVAPQSGALVEREAPVAVLCLLNAFTLRVDSEPVALPLPAQRVLAFVALSERPVMRSAVAARLWLDGTEEHALGSLRSALWRLRREGVTLLGTSNGRLELDPRVTVDVRRLVAWARNEVDGVMTGDARCDLDQIRSPGELLPDWYDDWVVLERERLREVRIRGLETLCERLTAAHEFGHASEAALAAIADDPLRESAYRCLIGVHLSEGNRAEAIRTYRMFRERLRAELGLAPSPKIDALVAEVMTQ
jgi:DNA-binding SARP family transcriptional activator